MEQQLGTLAWAGSSEVVRGWGQWKEAALVWNSLLGHPPALTQPLHADRCPKTLLKVLPPSVPSCQAGQPSWRGHVSGGEAPESEKSPFTHCDLLPLFLGLSSHLAGFKEAADLPKMRQEEAGSWVGESHSCRLLVGGP